MDEERKQKHFYDTKLILNNKKLKFAGSNAFLFHFHSIQTGASSSMMTTTTTPTTVAFIHSFIAI